MISKALVIDEPWITKILHGEKDWELRSTNTACRKRIGFIRKGSGHVVGVARVAGVQGPLTLTDLKTHADRHRVPESIMEPFEHFKWRWAWQLKDVVLLSRPVRYEHPPGAVIWVRLSNAVVNELENQIAGPEQDLQSRSALRDEHDQKGEENMAEQHDSKSSAFRVLPLTQGNLDNNHIYLGSIGDWFPASVIGGSNRHSAAEQRMKIHWGGTEPVETDIAGDKMIFRKRAWLRDFFNLHGLQAGDEVRITRFGDLEYRLTANQD